MVDGTIINTGGGAGIMGMTGGYVADIANAQEVNVQISGALGESETGGASINIIPRTGGNRFAGNYFTTYTRKACVRTATTGVHVWFSRTTAVPESQRLPARQRPRRVGGVWRADQARPPVVLLDWRGWGKEAWNSQASASGTTRTPASGARTTSRIGRTEPLTLRT